MGAVIQASVERPAPEALERAAEALRAGGVVVLPTDTVYGVAQAIGPNPHGAAGLFALKRRPPEKTIPWLVADPDALTHFGVDVPAWAHALARAFWPGGLTLVVRASDAVPTAYRGKGDTIALREPDAPLVRGLARACGGALAVTSANTSGAPSPRSFAELEARIVEGAALTIDGQAARIGVASTIVDCTSDEPVILRAGAVPSSDIFSAAQAG